jgi:hypothetical protein
MDKHIKLKEFSINDKAYTINLINSLKGNLPFLEQCMNHIIYGIENDLLYVSILKINFANNTDIMYLNINRDEWTYWLNLYLTKLLEYEEYEKCNSVKNLIDFLEII